VKIYKVHWISKDNHCHHRTSIAYNKDELQDIITKVKSDNNSYYKIIESEV
jgi:hypothetical protein